MRSNKKRKTTMHRTLTILTVVSLFVVIGLVGYILGNSSDLNVTSSAITGSAVKAADVLPSVSAEEDWSIVVDELISLGPSKVYSVFGEAPVEGLVLTKFAIKSDEKVEAHIITKPEECVEIVNGKHPKKYGCEPSETNVYGYEGECGLPPRMGLCVINEGEEEASIDVKIERKI